MKPLPVILALAGLFLQGETANCDEGRLSSLSEECIACHASVTPGLVEDWRKSRHANVTPSEGLKRQDSQRRISADKIPEKLGGVVVGCAECHMLNVADHSDSFAHNDVKIHLTVSPKDCAVCHPVETTQFQKNLMAHARTNLAGNPTYQPLITASIGVQTLRGNKISLMEPDSKTKEDSCFHCHGTAIEVVGKEVRNTNFGEMEFPKLTGWPNQGVGRHNPDASEGSCSSCHTRHQFSIRVARKPYTCAQCHKGPDVPAYMAYSVSKHGALAASLGSESKYEEVPWIPGKDFSAPTCAACHVSLVATTDGEVISKRTHQMNDRLPWRLFGLIYAHPHPLSPDTTAIRNKNNLALPTSLDGEPASKYLITAEEQGRRRDELQKLCYACHTREWVKGHWDRLENTIKATDEMTRTATRIMQEAWTSGIADQKTNMFDETIEKMWTEQWLFFANSTRIASAMMGADYGVFANGRWQMSKRVQELMDYSSLLLTYKEKKH